MPYVNRNKQGEITELMDAPTSDESQWVEVSHPDVTRFLQNPKQAGKLKQLLNSSDSDIVRVVEDVVDVLMEKGVFAFTELPEAAQGKLNARKKLREDVSSLINLIGEEDNIL
ncbi:MAG: hypothetical protein V7682_01010 [Cycloclasticus sp.]